MLERREGRKDVHCPSYALLSCGHTDPFLCARIWRPPSIITASHTLTSTKYDSSMSCSRLAGRVVAHKRLHAAGASSTQASGVSGVRVREEAGVPKNASPRYRRGSQMSRDRSNTQKE